MHLITNSNPDSSLHTTSRTFISTRNSCCLKMLPRFAPSGVHLSPILTYSGHAVLTRKLIQFSHQSTQLPLDLQSQLLPNYATYACKATAMLSVRSLTLAATRRSKGVYRLSSERGLRSTCLELVRTLKYPVNSMVACRLHHDTRKNFPLESIPSHKHLQPFRVLRVGHSCRR